MDFLLVLLVAPVLIALALVLELVEERLPRREQATRAHQERDDVDEHRT